MFAQFIGVALLILIFPLVVSSAEDNYQFIKKWGSKGSSPGEFSFPHPIGVDTFDNIYVGDNTGRIQKFDGNGTFIATIIPNEGIQIVDGAIDPDDNIFLITNPPTLFTPNSTSHIKKFDSNGTFLKGWGTDGTGPGQFNDPLEISVDSSGNIYVADTWNHRIQKFDNNGNFIKEWGSIGTGPGEFKLIHGLAVDQLGNLFVVDDQYIFEGDDRIQKFDQNGTFIKEWGMTGDQKGEFRHPMAIEVDSSGNIYVADSHNNRIQKFDNNGIFITKWGTTCSLPDAWFETKISTIDASKSGCIDPDGKGPLQVGDGQFQMPFGIAVDSNNNIYIGDYNHRIQKFAIN